MKTLFIVNPHSSTGNYQQRIEQIKKQDSQAVVYISQSVEQMNSFLDQNLNEIDLIVAVGGDGTISTIAKKLIDTDKILAVLPAGSGNGFARETSFLNSITDLFDKIKQGKTTKIDTFSINEHLSINVSGVGLDAMIVDEFEKTDRGFSNYIISSIKSYFNFDSMEIQFGKEFESYNGKYMMMNAANTRQFGNNAYIAPNASYNDGLIDIVLVKKFPLWYSVIFAYRMFSGKIKQDKYVSLFTTQELQLHSSLKKWHLDGEAMDMNSDVKIKVHTKNLRILV